jgi:hypothetical protein
LVACPCVLAILAVENEHTKAIRQMAQLHHLYAHPLTVFTPTEQENTLSSVQVTEIQHHATDEEEKEDKMEMKKRIRATNSTEGRENKCTAKKARCSTKTPSSREDQQTKGVSPRNRGPPLTVKMIGIELPSKIVELILTAVDPLSWTSCEFVCRNWKYILNRLRKKRILPREYIFKVAAKGWLPVLQWARANGCPWDTSTVSLLREEATLMY